MLVVLDHAWAPCIRDYKKSVRPHRLGVVYPVEVLQSFLLPHMTYGILYKLV